MKIGRQLLTKLKNCALIVFLFSTGLAAQEIVVQGKVTDAGSEIQFHLLLFCLKEQRSALLPTSMAISLCSLRQKWIQLELLLSVSSQGPKR